MGSSLLSPLLLLALKETKNGCELDKEMDIKFISISKSGSGRGVIYERKKS
jgi:hypothetical protein